ncbi:MAG: DEAD/DEAH box helicase family protein, partial [Lachnospiraceae bacterium]|nr:DEAD/DEAH box helicase family protein [Lachnospiraceae bacterium]
MKRQNRKKSTKTEYVQLSLFGVEEFTDEAESVPQEEKIENPGKEQPKLWESPEEQQEELGESPEEEQEERGESPEEEQEELGESSEEEQEDLGEGPKEELEEYRESLEDEHVREVTSMELPMDWENFYDMDQMETVIQAESVADGFVKCLNHKGCVDIEYIAAITGEDYKTVIEKLKGSIYQNPDTWGDCFFKGWETAEEYLSGNVRKKLRTAREADQMYHGYFAQNVEALAKIIPPSVAAEDIYVTLGSPWIPTDVIEEFLRDMTGERWSAFKILHDENTGTWELEGNYKYSFFDLDFKARYGTLRKNAYDIFLRTLNMQSVVVYDTVDSDYTKSGKQSVVNKDETVLALEKQSRLISDFKNWIWKEPKRKKRLERIYEEKYCSVRKRHYDGSFLEFPGMASELSLYPYQRDAVARIIFSGNTLLAHDVGSGKTYVMIAAGMELKRMKLSEQNMYVVPNNLVGQWKDFFYTMYPGAYIKCVEPKLFTPHKREEVLADIRDGGYDAVIIAYSCFTQIPIS